MSNVRTRFAPSPTGYMHIGGMRTALFNWLWARHCGGTFVLRIDDTDRERNVDEALAPILHAFRWLGLDWDEGPEAGGPYGPYFQSQRTELYLDAAKKLLAAGKAYRDFDPPEQIRADREAAEKAKQNYVNIRRSLDLTEAEIERYVDEGRPAVVRFLIPREQKVAIDDSIRGHVEWDGSLMPDPVILRADNSPLYNFATVIDDAQMHISHVIRAEEHLSNTPIQVLIHQALGNPLPQYAHIPYVAAPGSKEKLSKRDKQIEKYRKNPQFMRMFELADTVLPRIGLGSSETLNPVMVEYYEKVGYLPDAVFNALSRLGWSLDDKTEILSRETVVQNFTLDRVIKSPAGLDPDKLTSFQSHWMNQLPLDAKLDGCLPYLQKAGMISDVANEATRDAVGRVIVGMSDRLKIFSDILDYDEFFVADDQMSYDEKAFDKRIRNAPEALPLLRKFRARLQTAEPFTAAHLDKELHEFIAAEGVDIGSIIHALRLAVTGKAKGIGMFDCLEILGKNRSLARIDAAISRI